MSLNKYRPMADKWVKKWGGSLIEVHPNTYTWTAFLLAVLAGYFYYLSMPILLILVSLATAMSAFFDALDGAVARIAKIASKRGDLLDHVLDRYADIFILGGITFSAYCRPWLGFLGILGVLLTSYMGTQAQALGGKRDYEGILGRANRLAILVVVPLLYLFFSYAGIAITSPYSTNVIELAVVYFAVAGNLTAIQRALGTWKSLK